jgi:hypothetical protein
MRIFPLIMLLQLVSLVSPNATAERSPDSVARELYQQVVARRPLGIPKGADKEAIWPFLSKGLIQRLDAAQACENDYFRQYTDKDSKPGFGWLETDLFSGANEKATPPQLLWSARSHRRMVLSMCIYDLRIENLMRHTGGRLTLLTRSIGMSRPWWYRKEGDSSLRTSFCSRTSQ